MKVIAGLGNPGRQYENTRHNIGFAAVDYIAGKNQIEFSTKKHKALIGSGYLGGQKVLLIKPQTFMNLSGESLRGIMDFYKLDPSDFIVSLMIYLWMLGRLGSGEKEVLEDTTGSRASSAIWAAWIFRGLRSAWEKNQRDMIWQIMCLGISLKERGKSTMMCSRMWTMR